MGAHAQRQSNSARGECAGGEDAHERLVQQVVRLC